MRRIHGPDLSRATKYRRAASAKREQIAWEEHRLNPLKKRLGQHLVDQRQDYLLDFAASLMTVLCERGSVIYGSWEGVKPSERVLETFEDLKRYHPALLAVVAIDLAKLALKTKGSRRIISGNDRKEFKQGLIDDGYDSQSVKEMIKAAEDCNYSEPWVRQYLPKAHEIDDRAFTESQSTSSAGTPAHRVAIRGYGKISRRMACHWSNHPENKIVRAALVELLAAHGRTPPRFPLLDDVANTAPVMNQAVDLHRKRKRGARTSTPPKLMTGAERLAEYAAEVASRKPKPS